MYLYAINLTITLIMINHRRKEIPRTIGDTNKYQRGCVLGNTLLISIPLSEGRYCKH